jgi:hypothetical protein
MSAHGKARKAPFRTGNKLVGLAKREAGRRGAAQDDALTRRSREVGRSPGAKSLDRAGKVAPLGEARQVERTRVLGNPPGHDVEDATIACGRER